MTQFSEVDLQNLEKLYRTQLINSVLGYKSLVLVGTKNEEGKENLAIFNSLFHVGAHPALCGLVVRPNQPTANTLGNILSTKSYTLNHIQPSFIKQAHQCSAKYEPGKSEFDATGLKPSYQAGIWAPFVAESCIRWACELVQKIDLPINGTYILIGKILQLQVPDDCIESDGFVDLYKAKTVTGSGLDAYYTTEKYLRLSYAKKDSFPKEIDF